MGKAYTYLRSLLAAQPLRKNYRQDFVSVTMNNVVQALVLVLCTFFVTTGYWSYGANKKGDHITKSDLPLKTESWMPLCVSMFKELHSAMQDDRGVTPPGALSPPTSTGVDTKLRDHYLTIMKLSITGVLAGKSAGACSTSDNCGCNERLPFNYETRERGGDWPPYGTTMVGIKRLSNIQMAIEDVAKNNVPGDFAELGVWRGGACIFAKAAMKAYGLGDRQVYVFDAMEMFEAKHAYGKATNFLAVSEADLKEYFEMYHLMDDTIIFKKGFFIDTVPAFASEYPDTQFAILRIDGNFYDSYQDVLYAFYERVPVGGYVIFDDILLSPDVQLCWDHFKADHGLPEVPLAIDRHSAYFKKIKDVKIDKSKKRPDRDVNLKH